jgi:hypothetical protein
MKVLRVNIYCQKCGQKGFIDFTFMNTVKILILLLFGQPLSSEFTI